MKAVVTGISGQDGYYMAQKLMGEGIEVIGLTSDMQKAALDYADISHELVSLREFDFETPGQFDDILEEFEPSYIFNFAAKASGQGMFDMPYLVNRLNGVFVVDILDAIRQSSRADEIVFCQASSSEMFGNVTETPQNELTPFRPKSPYGAAKLYAHNMVDIYRANYGVKCCSAILYNHESARRSVNFVTKKIANAAVRIKLGEIDQVALGSLDAKRDWGYAPEYVDAMYRMACSEKLQDYVIATGKLHSVRELCEAAFGHLDLDFTEFVHSQTDNLRKVESVNLLGNPVRIEKELGWRANKTVKEIMVELVDFELNRLQ